MTKTNHYLRALAAIAVMALMACLLAAKPAHASTTFTVNSTGDSPDAILNDILFTNICADSQGQCTLRAAIQEANHTPGPDTIRFNIPGSGVKTINVGSTGLGDLPYITDPVTIDGYTQPGASPNTLLKGNDAQLEIALNGTNVGPPNAYTYVYGLNIQADNSVVRGLVINRFGDNGDGGIRIYGGEDNRIEGNFIGTDPSGTQDLGNGGTGVLIHGAYNTIGGVSPDKRNVISGNANQGVGISGFEGNEVVGNYIGTTKDGTGALGNDEEGVIFYGNATNNAVGSLSYSGGANTIAFNGEHGVGVYWEDTTRNSILGNSIFSNGGMGIELGTDGPTGNDSLDTDTGFNGLQNYPDLTTAKTVGAKTTIKGELNSVPNEGSFTVQFFSNPPGADEGKKFIGQTSVMTGADGKATFTFKSAKKVPVGRTMTATATDPNGSTSEFSSSREVVQQ